MSKSPYLRYSLVLLLLLITATFDASAKDEQWDSKLIPQGVTLTGKRADFPAGTMAMLEDQKASFGLCNDSQFLYIMLALREPMYAGMIRRTGLTIWLDASGKKAKDFMIKYVGGPSREQMMTLRRQGTEMPERDLPPEMRERMQERMNEPDSARGPEFVCFQKDRISEKPIPVDGTEGPSAVFGVDQGFCVYEFRIPLRESEIRNYGMGVKQGQKFSVGLIWGEMSQERREHRMQMSGGPGMGGGGMEPPGGMGGGQMGGRGEGPGGGPGGGMMRGGRMPEKQEVWVKSKVGVSGE